MANKFRRRNGYTLMEAAIVFILVAILSFGIGSFLVSSTRLWLFLNGRQSAVKIAQASLNRMVTEIKKIKSKNDLLTMGTYEVQFNTFDLATSEDFKQVGSSLVRVSGANTNTLAQSLASPGLVFTYLNSLDAVTAVTKEVRTIRIWLYLSSNSQSYTLETSARIRANELH